LTQLRLKMSAILEEAFVFAFNVLLRRRHPRGPLRALPARVPAFAGTATISPSTGTSALVW
jgi:hypothetical protein